MSDASTVQRRGLLRALATLPALPALPALSCVAAPARAAAAPTHGAPYADHPLAQSFVAEVAERRQWPARWLAGRLAQAQRLAAVQRLIMPGPPGTARNWRAYRERFVEPDRIGAGLAYWARHARWFEQAEQRFGVPADIVLGILGVESYYGRITGGFRAIDALATLAFDFPAGRSDRSGFFRGELEELFVWCAREGIDPVQPRGSYAGAIGLPQFMPSSINRYAVDFDADGRVDLAASAADVVGSVASYLAAFGWKAGQPTHFDVQPPADPQALATLREPDIKPSFSAAQMHEQGARLGEAAMAHMGPLALVALENGGDAPTHVAGSENFYAITRYNWSAYYAMAVIDLAAALRGARPGPAPKS